MPNGHQFLADWSEVTMGPKPAELAHRADRLAGLRRHLQPAVHLHHRADGIANPANGRAALPHAGVRAQRRKHRHAPGRGPVLASTSAASAAFSRICPATPLAPYAGASARAKKAASGCESIEAAQCGGAVERGRLDVEVLDTSAEPGAIAHPTADLGGPGGAISKYKSIRSK